MASDDTQKRGSLGLAIGLLTGAGLAIAGTAWGIGSAARDVFLAQEEEIIPVIAGSELDSLPALMRGNRLAETTSFVRGLPQVAKPPRMCEMPDEYFDTLQLTPERECLSPLKLCHYLFGMGWIKDGSEAVFG